MLFKIKNHLRGRYAPEIGVDYGDSYRMTENGNGATVRLLSASSHTIRDRIRNDPMDPSKKINIHIDRVSTFNIREDVLNRRYDRA